MGSTSIGFLQERHDCCLPPGKRLTTVPDTLVFVDDVECRDASSERLPPGASQPEKNEGNIANLLHTIVVMYLTGDNGGTGLSC